MIVVEHHTQTDSDVLWSEIYDRLETATQAWDLYSVNNPSQSKGLQEIGTILGLLPDALVKWSEESDTAHWNRKELLTTRKKFQRARAELTQLAGTWKDRLVVGLCNHNVTHTKELKDLIERIWNDES